MKRIIDNMGDLFEFVMWTDKVSRLLLLVHYQGLCIWVAMGSSRKRIAARGLTTELQIAADSK